MKYNVVILQGMRNTYKGRPHDRNPGKLNSVPRNGDVLWRYRINGQRISLRHRQAGRCALAFEPYKALPRLVADAIGRGEKIRAIKSWREATGAGLREAKDFIEEAQRRSSSGTRG
jgi:hypothetical protein